MHIANLSPCRVPSLCLTHLLFPVLVPMLARRALQLSLSLPASLSHRWATTAPFTRALMDAKRATNISFGAVADAMQRKEEWVVSTIFGETTPTLAEASTLAEILGVPPSMQPTLAEEMSDPGKAAESDGTAARLADDARQGSRALLALGAERRAAIINRLADLLEAEVVSLLPLPCPLPLPYPHLRPLPLAPSLPLPDIQIMLLNAQVCYSQPLLCCFLRGKMLIFCWLWAVGLHCPPAPLWSASRH